MPSRTPGRLGMWGLLIMTALLFASGAWANSATVGPGDWPYQELDALAQAGLLSGRPTAPLGEWAGDSLTRYEAASLTLRAVEGIGAAYQAQGEKLTEIAKAEDTSEAATATAMPAVGPLDLARVEKLIEEFRTELVTMGARVDDLETAMEDVQSRLAKVEADQKKHKLDGYLQVRYQDDDASDSSEFLVRRTRFNIRGPVTDAWSYRVEFQLDAKEDGKGPNSKTQLRTLYADYKTDAGLLRIGQAKVPWGYELLEAVPNLWTSERALFMDRLFPNQRDIGVQYAYKLGADRPQVDVGIFNGTGINASDNNKKNNVMARVNVPVPNGSVAVSGYVGKNGDGATATDQDRYGVSAKFAWPCGTQFMSEFVTGEDRGSDVRGWYGQVGHPISAKRPNLLFVKYDQYDEDTDLADNLFKRWSFGYWYELDAATRLTLVHESRDPDDGFSELSKWQDSRTWLQLQLKY
ncbi:MAG: porin [Armatimonadetes bacterium]|nr:porin [Armatimonadota bacterium]